MMKKLLFILIASTTFSLSAQVETINIDWSFSSNPTQAITAPNYTNKTIEVGDTVTWTWSANGSSHNVNSTTGENFESAFSGAMGFTFSHTFTSVGSNDYQCDPHSTNMFGTITVVADGTLSTQRFEKSPKFSIYPNPGNNTMNINVPRSLNTGLELEVFNVLGKKIYSNLLTGLISKVDIAKWNSGLYLVRLSSPKDDVVLTKRFVKL